MERCTPQRRLYWNMYWYVNMFSLSFLPSYLWLFPSIQQPCQVQPHATMCNISSEEMSGFPMGSGGQGRLSLHVSCCSVSFFQLSMSHVLELKVSETSTWLEEVGLCSIVVELCGNCAALSGSSQAGCRIPTLMALGKMLREGFDPSATGEIYERKNAFPGRYWGQVWFLFETKSHVSRCFCTLLSDVYLVWSTYIHLWSEALLRGVMLSVFGSHIHSFVLKSTPQRRLPI